MVALSTFYKGFAVFDLIKAAISKDGNLGAILTPSPIFGVGACKLKPSCFGGSRSAGLLESTFGFVN